MISYDEGFDPPAMVVSVTLSGVVDEGSDIDVQAIIDTGADITAIPRDLEGRLGLYPFSKLQMEDARGFKEAVYTYEARVAVEDSEPVTMEVILVPFPFAVLGRDWL